MDTIFTEVGAFLDLIREARCSNMQVQTPDGRAFSIAPIWNYPTMARVTLHGGLIGTQRASRTGVPSWCIDTKYGDVLDGAWDGDDEQHPPMDAEAPECRELWKMLHEVARAA